MKKLTKVDLGLAIGCATDSPFYGVPISEYVQAALCCCTAQNISLIYVRGMAKLRRSLTEDEWELLNYIFCQDRETGKPNRKHLHRGEIT
jgi:hypothetical protein